MYACVSIILCVPVWGSPVKWKRRRGDGEHILCHLHTHTDIVYYPCTLYIRSLIRPCNLDQTPEYYVR